MKHDRQGESEREMRGGCCPEKRGVKSQSTSSASMDFRVGGSLPIMMMVGMVGLSILTLLKVSSHNGYITSQRKVVIPEPLDFRIRHTSSRKQHT